MRRGLGVLLAAAALAVAAPAPAVLAAEPPPNADWSEMYFPCAECNPGGAGGEATMLHADVFRPKGLPADAKTPVIMTVTPYGNHSGSTGDGNVTDSGPNPRFFDFLHLSGILERGYTYVMVDLPGFGGSGGCNDWGGPVERAAVKRAVEWGASAPWSTGKVGLIGKSYDGWTGIMGIAEQPQGLAAVVSQEPVYSGYRYFHMNGVRFSHAAATPAGFQSYDAMPGTINDNPQYLINGAPRAYCYGTNIAGAQMDAESDPWGAERNLIPAVQGKETPLLLTQGYLESNTKPDGAFDVFNGVKGPKWGWFGQFDHVRGWDRENMDPPNYGEGRFLVGRDGFIAHVNRFFDHFVKGVPQDLKVDPVVTVQDNYGRYRSEAQWPPADATVLTTSLRTGGFTDVPSNGAGDASGVWTVSAPLAHETWLAGEPILDAVVEAEVPRSNLSANVYDIAPDGKAVLVSRGVMLLRSTTNEVTLQMYGQDWVFAPGHRIGVRLASGNGDFGWTHVHTEGAVDVVQAALRLPFLTRQRRDFGAVEVTDRLTQQLETEVVDAAPVIDTATAPFELPGELLPPLTPPAAKPPAVRPAGSVVKLTAKVRAAKRRLTVTGAAPAGSRVTVLVMKGKRRAARKVVAARGTRYRAVLKLKRRGTYTVRVSGAGQRVAKRVRVR
jgi:uncharacterized protein